MILYILYRRIRNEKRRCPDACKKYPSIKRKMGNNTSVFSSGAAISMSLKGGGNVSGGEALEGTVYCEVFKDKIDCDNVTIEFVGQEKTQVRYESGSGKHRHTHYAHQTADIIRANYFLHQCNDKYIYKGRYEFPFSIQLANSLPPSFYHGESGHYAQIVYSLEARLHRYGALSWDVKNVVPLTMYGNNAQIIPNPVCIEPVTTRVKYWCCIDKGAMSLGTKVNSATIRAGDNAVVDFAVYNNSEATVKAIVVAASTRIGVQAGIHSASMTLSVIDKRIDKQDLKHVDKTKREAAADESQVNALLKSELDNAANRVSFPVTTTPTYLGAIINVKTWLDTSIRTPFCVDDPSLQININVVGATKPAGGPVAIQNENHFDLPADWNAKRSDEVKFNNNNIKRGNNELYATSSNIPSAPADPNIKFLCDGLTSCFDELPVVSEWVTYGDLSALTPDNFTQIFTLIRNAYNYSAVAAILGKAMQGSSCGGVTCAQIAGALNAIQAYDATTRVTIATAFHSYCKNRSDATDVFTPLFPNAPFNLNQVLALYR